MNTPIIRDEIITVLQEKKLPTKVQDLMATKRNSTKYVKNSKCPYFPNNSKKLKSRETLPNLLYEATVTVIPKSDKIL